MNSLSGNTLVWIGAGSASIPEVNFGRFEKVYLFEANVDTFEELKDKFEDNSKVTVKQWLIAGKNEERIFSSTNLPELSACAEFEDIKIHYPGVRVVSKDKFFSKTLKDVLAEAQLLDDSESILVLDVFCEEKAIIESIEAETIQSVFKSIITLKSGIRYFNTSSKEPELQQLLVSFGYIPTTQTELEAEVCYQHYTLNPLLADFKKLEEVAKTLELDYSEAQAQLAEKSKIAETSTEEIRRLFEALESVEQDNEVLKGKLDSLEKLTKSQNSSLKKAEEDAAKVNSDLEKQLALYKSLEEELSQKVSLLSECNTKNNSLSDEVVSLKDQLKESLEARQNTDKELKHLEAKQQMLESELNDKREHVSDCKTQIESHNSEITTLRLQLEEITKSRDSAISKLQNQQEENTSLKSKFEEKSKWLSEHEKWNESLKHETEELKAKLKGLNEELASEKAKSEKLVEVQSEAQEQQFKNERLHIELEKFEAQLELLTQFVKG